MKYINILENKLGSILIQNGFFRIYARYMMILIYYYYINDPEFQIFEENFINFLVNIKLHRSAVVDNVLDEKRGKALIPLEQRRILFF